MSVAERLVDKLPPIPPWFWLVLLGIVASGWMIVAGYYMAREAGFIQSPRQAEHDQIADALSGQTVILKDNNRLLNDSVTIQREDSRRALGDCVNKWSVYPKLSDAQREIFIDRCYSGPERKRP